MKIIGCITFVVFCLSTGWIPFLLMHIYDWFALIFNGNNGELRMISNGFCRMKMSISIFARNEKFRNGQSQSIRFDLMLTKYREQVLLYHRYALAVFIWSLAFSTWHLNNSIGRNPLIFIFRETSRIYCTHHFVQITVRCNRICGLFCLTFYGVDLQFTMVCSRGKQKILIYSKSKWECVRVCSVSIRWVLFNNQQLTFNWKFWKTTKKTVYIYNANKKAIEKCEQISNRLPYAIKFVRCKMWLCWHR